MWTYVYKFKAEHTGELQIGAPYDNWDNAYDAYVNAMERLIAEGVNLAEVIEFRGVWPMGAK